jgi:threonine dehydrogenase-like Zn-dependent dehydrogenase
MRAVLCDRPGTLSLIDRPEPKPAADEALLRIRRIGVCGTDYHILGGRQPYLNYPRVMGTRRRGGRSASR